MDIHQLRLFASVYKNKSFSKASGELHISQPTISEHIKNLESDLGCKLFDRLGRSILPTKEAEAIYPRTLEIIQALERLREDAAKIGATVKGRLVIGASTIPGTYNLPILLSEFKKQYPDVFFEILIEDSRKITDMVLNHELTLGVVGALMEQEKLEGLPFLEDELVLAAKDQIVKTNTVNMKQLVDVPFILREEGSGTRKTMETFLSKSKIDLKDLNVSAVLGSTSSVKQAIKAGLGASILSRVAIQEELDRGLLKEIKIKGVKMKRNFYLIFHKKRTFPNPYHAFFSYIRALKQSK